MSREALPLPTKWVTLSGTCDLLDNKITYTPLWNSDQDDQEQLEIARLSSNETFQTGTIAFTVNFEAKEDIMCLVQLGEQSQENQGVLAGLWSSDNSVFMIANTNPQAKPSRFVYSGHVSNLQENHDYHVRIEVNGSRIQLYIDDVLVSSTLGTVHRSPIKLRMRSKSKIVVRDFTVQTSKPLMFVVMQFSDEYDQIFKLIKDVSEPFGYECVRADTIFRPGAILEDITKSIIDATVIIADVTTNNPNVFYELGYAHASQKTTILLSNKTREDGLPFDISGFRTLFYANTIAGKTDMEDSLKKYLKNINLA